MLNRAKNRFKFLVERTLLRGAHYRLLLIAALIGLVAALGGVVVLQTEGVESGFTGPGEAVWWAFLRLTDPGYLGDDEGLVRRVVSTAITVLGYVLFMGALIAIMSQWLTQTMRRLESGLTPIAQSDHVLVLGWTNRTASIVEELLSSSEERLHRFLQRHGARRLNIAILAEDVSAELVQELRDHLGPLWDGRRIIFRTGTPLDLDHLRRVDFANAAAIILPGSDYGGAMTTDTRTIKTMLSISQHVSKEGQQKYPLLVAEIFDARKVMVGVRAYNGPVEVISSDLFISRLIAQTLRHPGLSQIFNELLSGGDANEVYVRGGDALAGARLQDLTAAFPKAILLGALRPDAHGGFDALLNAPAETKVQEGDRLVFIARQFEETTPPSAFVAEPQDRGAAVAVQSVVQERRILVLGWSHRAPALLSEFDSYVGEKFEIDVISYVSAADRQSQLDSHDVRLERVRLHHYEGDFTAPMELRRLRPQGYDGIVILGSDWLESAEQSDARTVLGHLLLRELIGDEGPQVLVELMDPENVALFSQSPSEALVSPQIISHMLAQISLRRELRIVFDELFGPGGAEISFHSAAHYNLAGRVSFAQVQAAAMMQGETALGLRLRDGLHLNPDKAQQWELSSGDELVVLATYEQSAGVETVSQTKEVFE
jgi:hypothetical protein